MRKVNVHFIAFRNMTGINTRNLQKGFFERRSDYGSAGADIGPMQHHSYRGVV